MASLAEKVSAEAGALPSERQRAALKALAAAGLPTARDENWKYANLRLLEKVKFAPSSKAPSDVRVEELPALIEGYARYTFVDGVFVQELSKPNRFAGVEVRTLRAGVSGSAAAPIASPGSPLGWASPGADLLSSGNPRFASGDERFALLNDVFATDGTVVQVAKGVDCPGCIELLFVATESAQVAASYPRVDVEVGENARLGIIERHISLRDDGNFVNAFIDVRIAPGAQVTHYRLQQAGARATCFDTLSATVERDARYEVHAVNLGALSARSTLHIQLAGEHAELALHVAALGDGQQTLDAYALVEHAAPHTKSEQTVRAIAGGRSRVAFNSKVVVRENAKGTDSRQSLRGLLAGTQSEIDVRPQLEIYTDDVRCNHGATAGKLDDNMLFYLLSRGIDRDTAQQLLKWAFLEDVVSKIKLPELRKHIEANLAGQMQETAALKELI